ncbi:MAG: dipeptidase [Arenimonas sp.]|jgi:membrane dipeptidase
MPLTTAPIPQLMAVAMWAFATFASAAPGGDDAAAVHRRVLTIDSHVDTPTFLLRKGWDIGDRHRPQDDFSQLDLPRMEQGGLDAAFFAVYLDQGPLTPEGYERAHQRGIVKAVAIREAVLKHGDGLELALTVEDARRIVASGRHAIFMSMENAYPVGRDLSLLPAFHALGVRMIGLVHEENNDFADSATDDAGPKWHGLSDAGRELVRRANDLGMVVDGSHASDEALDDIIATSRTPVILSHSGVRALLDHPRNLDDARLERLAASGGVIQIEAYSPYLVATPRDPPEREGAEDALLKELGISSLSQATPGQKRALIAGLRALDQRFGKPRAGIDDFVAQLLYALRRVGPDHVGIGSDFDGGGGVAGLEDVSDYPEITRRLIQAGYDESDIAKIWGGNVLRLVERAQAAGKTR